MNATPALLAALLMLASLARAAEKPPGFDAFDLLRTRPIFDPERRAVKKDAELARIAAATAAAAARPRSVHLTLTGTLVSDGRALAFFSGSRSEFHQIIGVGEKVGDFTVAAITGAEVTLKHGDKATPLAVGKRLQLEGTEADASEPDPAPPSTSTPTTPSAPAPAAAGSPSDVLKRMMERRAQEMKK